MVRVFNRDFVNENVFGEQGPAGIVVLGAKSVEMQKELHTLNEEIRTKQRDLDSNTTLINQKVGDQVKYCSRSARDVKDVLTTAGPRDMYTNYESPDFIACADALAATAENGQTLGETEKDRLLAFVRAERRSPLQPLTFSFRPAEQLSHKAKELCQRSVVSTVLEDLRNRPDVNVWAGHGLTLHRQYGTDKCLFCNQPLPKERLAALEAHFSQEYARLAEDLDMLIREIRAERQEAEGLQLRDEEALYPDMHEEYGRDRQALDNKRQEYTQALDALIEVLDKKKADPFRDFGDEIAVAAFEDSVVGELNRIIAEHNKKVENHEDEVKRAKGQIEQSMVLQALPDYTRLDQELQQLGEQVRTLNEGIRKLEERRLTLEADLRDHLRPAAELNQDLTRYLGHHELQFDVLETGYRIVRNGSPAESLSEGEKTAIAFLYFLKSLEDKDFDIENGIVVIDDPVSSLDSNALYYAFGFMKSRVRDAGQLFILTHNFLFFRQVKNWFEHLPKKDGKQVCHYMLEVRGDEGVRCSSLVALDPLLKKFESEYHYLFSLVYSASQASGHERDLEQHYSLPNVARRLLEAFLQFKFPGNDSFYASLEKANLDSAKKTRIYRFCQTHSHNQMIDEPEHDPSILGEATPVAKDIMELIKEMDHVHFEHMIQLVARAQRDESAP